MRARAALLVPAQRELHVREIREELQGLLRVDVWRPKLLVVIEPG